ncbi:MAG: glucosaminidase domain-containing protein [Saprospiraceae bacterium]
MIQKWILAGGLLFIFRLGFCQDYMGYIDLYKDIAVTEMERTGIPASIKLAQGILESNCGKSDLACKASNHFGIKCGSGWCGKCFKKEDDDFEDGKLIKSCFREFPSANDSYIAHSDFLTDPAKSNRYGFLFDLKSTDYKSWARGLAKAGYATDPHYAERLIDIIEKYNLNDLDMDINGHQAITSSGTPKSYHAVRYFNDIKYIIAGQHDTPLSLATELDVRARQINSYNDDIKDEQQWLVPGSRVYLQPKRNKFNGHQQYHMLKGDEDLVAVSQKYGIKLSALQKRNGLADGAIPSPNQRLALKGKLKSELRIADPYAAPVMKKNDDTNASANKNANVEIPPSTHVAPLRNTKIETIVTTPQKPVVLFTEHTVSKGETLYGIGHLYGMSVVELKKMNNLSVDTLSVGQKLVVK